MIFVFGSNEAGHHGAGAAKHAIDKLGAFYGMGFGPAGNTFAIPTKDWRIQTLPIVTIEHYVQRFIVYARIHGEQLFQVTRIGCGLAGLQDRVIAPMFKYAPVNCQFDQVWMDFLPEGKFASWGTF